MSDYLAVGGVSAVLKSMLTTALPQGRPSTILGATAGITNIAPDLVTTGPDETPQINLFLYYASINPALAQSGPAVNELERRALEQSPAGDQPSLPRHCVWQHPFDAEILLGWAMKVFHDTPVVPRETIEQALQDLVSVLPAPPEQQLFQEVRWPAR